MKIIKIYSKTFGEKDVLVDDEDYDFLMQWKWYVVKGVNTFYVVRNTRDLDRAAGIKSSHLKMHRVLLEVKNSKILVDHRDGDGLNNQKHNLRACTSKGNCKNTRSRRDSTSKFLGISLAKKKVKLVDGSKIVRYFWIAQVFANGTSKAVKMFPHTSEGEIAAAKWRDEQAKKYHGEFVNLNFKENDDSKNE